MNKGKTLFVLTARGGSKGIPGKNIRDLDGIPLLAYRILSAKRVNFDNDLYLSTDSEEIASIGIKYGAKIPFLRNPNLATDSAKCEAAVYEMAEYASKDNAYDFVCMLQPTSPFTRASDLISAHAMLNRNGAATAVVSTRQVHPSSYYIQRNSEYLDVISNRIKNSGLLRRQDELSEVTPSGNLYISRFDNFMHDQSFYRETTLNYLVQDPYGLEIDEPLDWSWAQFILEKKIIDRREILGDI